MEEWKDGRKQGSIGRKHWKDWKEAKDGRMEGSKEAKDGRKQGSQGWKEASIPSIAFFLPSFLPSFLPMLPCLLLRKEGRKEESNGRK